MFYEEKINYKSLLAEAEQFCVINSGVYKPELFGITDGKAIGTFVEHLFQQQLEERYDLAVGNSASGLDLPSINTDIKVTSINLPQSSCPFKERSLRLDLAQLCKDKGITINSQRFFNSTNQQLSLFD